MTFVLFGTYGHTSHIRLYSAPKNNLLLES